MPKTKALYVHYKFWYICSPYSAKQQREMTKFKILWRTLAYSGESLILSQLERRSHPFCCWIVRPHCTSNVNLYFQMTFSLAFPSWLRLKLLNKECLLLAVVLGSTPSLPAESCKEIKANEAGEVVSGNSWLDPTGSGDIVLAYCDMETEGLIIMKF